MVSTLAIGLVFLCVIYVHGSALVTVFLRRDIEPFVGVDYFVGVLY